MEQMSSYASQLKSAIAGNLTFKEICNYNIQNYQQGWYEKNKATIANGRGLLHTSEQGITYMASYSDMHQLKLNLAFSSLFGKEDFKNASVEIVDWGCGQAFASCVLIDYIQDKTLTLDLTKFTLIEPSIEMLQRGAEHIEALYQNKPKPNLYTINEKADTTLSLNGFQNKDKIKVHLFSNIIDIATIDLKKVVQNVTNNFEGVNYFVCVSPLNEARLQTFYKMFTGAVLVSSVQNSVITQIFRPTAMKKITKTISRIEYIFKTNL